MNQQTTPIPLYILSENGPTVPLKSADVAVSVAINN